ncbi:family 1 glycosylhydrolase [Williamsia sp. 1138]|uniref:family 1 glycosylhydrolase n=1 Tax=Williamsia sp. 1138 TaxID=1903117 RepID=UPI000A0F538D|nr:family 1 glycosylhydrolase [Williamsia sp. 1138]
MIGTTLIRRLMMVALPVIVALAILPAPAHAQAPGLGQDFLWGVGSAGFQSEGSSPDSNWLRYSSSDRVHDPVGTSVDFRHRYVEDITNAKLMGVKVYRISVEWARIQPKPGVWDQRELEYYDRVMHYILLSGMRPMITLDHWVYPGWAVDRGGWNNPNMVRDWLTNAKKVVDRYARFDPIWITVNEPLVYTFLKELSFGGIAPQNVPLMLDQLVQAHRTIYDYIHARQPTAWVTSNSAYLPTVQPVLDSMFLDRIKDKQDFVGIDYYYSVAATDLNTYNAATEEYWKASTSADGLYYALRYYDRKFPGKPLYIVENGMPTENGAPRPDGYRRADQLRDAAYWLARAKADGMNVVGYNYWSITDNYEWGSYTPRFGLYQVDVTSDQALLRRPTPAVAAYRDVIANGGVRSDYRPTRPAQFCSLVDAPTSCSQPVR